jgi:predicted O-methyltransferase YrrM
MFNLRLLIDYLLHRLKAKNRHGLHSPFVYRFTDEVFYGFGTKKVYNEIENLRQGLITDKRIINITDLGAGTKANKSNNRAIGAIAKTALKPPKLAQLLYRMAADLRPATIIELGTCLGITTVYLQKACPDAMVYTLEGCPEIASVALETLKNAGANNVRLITGNFDDTFPALVCSLPRLDLVFIDGNHRREATLKYFEWCLPKVHENTLLIFDDIYWSEGMKEAWLLIKAHPKVTVTIDLFWIGLVYFKSGQAKEDFMIRF